MPISMPLQCLTLPKRARGGGARTVPSGQQGGGRGGNIGVRSGGVTTM